MDAEPGYDPTNFHALQRELERLNAAALASGLAAPREGWFESPAPSVGPGRAGKAAPPKPKKAKAPAKAKRKAAGGATAAPAKSAEAESKAPVPAPSARAENADTGKAGARRLLAMLSRVEGDASPAVPGTEFTESGVVRLLAHLRRPRSRQSRFLQRLRRFLTLPVAMGVHTAAGVSVERLQVASHRLLEIEGFGWDQFQSVRAARRAKRADHARVAREAPVPARKPAKPRSATKPRKAAEPRSATKPRGKPKTKAAT